MPYCTCIQRMVCQLQSSCKCMGLQPARAWSGHGMGRGITPDFWTHAWDGGRGEKGRGNLFGLHV
eukprot:253936-Chlamydomonas_euryale.AAC.1